MEGNIQARVGVRAARRFGRARRLAPLLLVLAGLGVAAACSPRFQRELDREIQRVYRPAVANVCSDDAARFCGSQARGAGRAATCLSQHVDELTPDCRAVVSGRETVRAACKNDLVSLCKEPAARPQLRLACLERSHDKLSGACRSALDDHRADL